MDFKPLEGHLYIRIIIDSFDIILVESIEEAQYFKYAIPIILLPLLLVSLLDSWDS